MGCLDSVSFWQYGNHSAYLMHIFSRSTFLLVSKMKFWLASDSICKLFMITSLGCFFPLQAYFLCSFAVAEQCSKSCYGHLISCHYLLLVTFLWTEVLLANKIKHSFEVAALRETGIWISFHFLLQTLLGLGFTFCENWSPCQSEVMDGSAGKKWVSAVETG